MIEKEIVFSAAEEECTVDPIFPSDGGSLEKVASQKVSDEIKDYIKDNIEKDPNFLYVLVSALGAGEIWGDNVNGDYFEEDEIKDFYKTFEKFGYVFTHHKNKDPKKSKGEILFAHWNPRMHRVELIVKIDRRKAPKIASDIDNGKMWDVSMGCKVPYDICSICGNKATTTDDYCVHIEEHKGEVLPDGRKVYMINKKPKFFDISFVYIGADKTAKSLLKIASRSKQAELKKEIPGEILSTDASLIAAKMMDGFERVKPYEQPIGDKVLDLLSDKPIGNILKTLLVLGIILKPREFQRIFVNKFGEDPDKYDTYIDPYVDGPVPKKIDKFKPFDGDVDIKIVKMATPYLEKRSSLKQYLYPRLIKMANEERPEMKEKKLFNPSDVAVPGLFAGSYLYKKYLDEVPDQAAEGLDKSIKDHPWVLPAVTIGGIGAIKGLQAQREAQSEFEKTASNLGGRAFAGLPAAHALSNIAGRINSRSKLIKFLEEHPNLVALLGIGATNSIDDWRAIKKALMSLQDEMEPVITKTAADMISTQNSSLDLNNDIEKLYNRYNQIDEKYDKARKVSNVVMGSQNPSQLLGSGIDMMAGSALNKILTNIQGGA